MNLEMIKKLTQNTMVDFLEIKITEVAPGLIKGEMPVSLKTIQPMRLLHGGASCAFAESLASIGGNALVYNEGKRAVGLEINANHIKSVPLGKKVFGEAKILHQGKNTHVWEIKITNEENKLICVSRMTLALLLAAQEEK